MANKTEPIITKITTKDDYTCITFEPDLKRFGMKELDNDIISLMTKRVYDLAGVTSQKVKVFLNDDRIEVNSFSEYVDMYLSTEENKELPKIYEKVNDFWEICVSTSDGQLQQVSFVNSICTSKGGTHVSYVADQIVQTLIDKIKKKNKKLVLKNHMIKSHLWIFINCLVENPAFDSQTKETLTTKASNYGSECVPSDKFLKGVANCGVIDRIIAVAEARDFNKMAKQLGAKKTSRLLGIPKLDDANDAGTRNADSCTLILTEGDSAKQLALSGIEVVGRDKYGVFPLRGKLLNVREATNKQITENSEIQSIMKIIGLQLGKKYTDMKSLRYGSIMIMTDQDHDGSHIKGLIINFIHHFWPSLIQQNGFLKEFITPIIKATKGNDQKVFFTIQEYENWAEGKNLKGYKIKYYKGLGTSTSKEAQEYFNELEKHKIEFKYADQEDDEALDLIFNKKKADARKDWLARFEQGTFINHNVKRMRYQEFVNKEFIMFSMADNIRSIPSICDGFKPGQRKIMFSCFKRNLRGEIKVAQLAGYVSEHSAYHHGEVSLTSTIVGMAQNFVGSNNINLLMPIGMFGSRNGGGKEAASARYIYTNLSKITRKLFKDDDDPLMNYLVEEGQRIEPDYYLPIIPMILVNGAEGIGTGWSTNVPQYNPREIVENLKKKMNGLPFTDMAPWYKGFIGEIIPEEDDNNYICNGVYEINEDESVDIFELPVLKWTRDYKAHLEIMASNKDKKGSAKQEELSDIKEYHTENKVHFQIKFHEDILDKYRNDFLKKMKLTNSINTTNMVLFNSKGKLQKYTSVVQVMEEFYELRLELYNKRKEYMLAKLDKDFQMLSSKARFILEVISEEIQIKKVKKKVIIETLIKRKYPTLTQLHALLKKFDQKTIIEVKEEEAKVNEVGSDDEVVVSGILAKDYDYLLGMQLWSLSHEKVEKLINERDEVERAIGVLNKKTIFDIWTADLDDFLDTLNKTEEEELKEIEKRNKIGKAMVKGKKGRVVSKPRKKKEEKKEAMEDIAKSATKRGPKKKIKSIDFSESTKSMTASGPGTYEGFSPANKTGVYGMFEKMTAGSMNDKNKPINEKPSSSINKNGMASYNMMEEDIDLPLMERVRRKMENGSPAQKELTPLEIRNLAEKNKNPLWKESTHQTKKRRLITSDSDSDISLFDDVNDEDVDFNDDIEDSDF